MRSAAEELSTRARIRDAAIARFGRDGFSAAVRLVAHDAGVSPALVIHHFGSKSALRRVCDDHVRRAIDNAKQQALDEAVAGQSLIARFASMSEGADLLRYVLRSLQHGGPVTKAFIDQMIDDAVAYIRPGVEAGLIHASRDEAARVRYLALSALGALMLEVTLDPPTTPDDLIATVRRFMTISYQPMLELYSQGLFTTPRIFEDYLASLSQQERGPE